MFIVQMDHFKKYISKSIQQNQKYLYSFFLSQPDNTHNASPYLVVILVRHQNVLQTASQQNLLCHICRALTFESMYILRQWIFSLLINNILSNHGPE